MPKRTKVTTVREELPPAEELETGPTIQDGLDGVEILLQSLEPEILRVEVYKGELTGKLEWCTTITGTEIDKESLRESYGGGRYELRIYEGARHIRTAVLRMANKVTPSLSPIGNLSPESAMMREQNQFFQKMVIALISKSDGISVKDLLPIIANRPSGDLTPDTMFNIFSKGMDIAGKVSSGSSDWKTELVSALRDALPQVGQALAMVSAARQPMQPNPNGNGVQQPSMLPDAVLKTVISEMKQQVLGGLPVNLAIDWVLANAQKPQYMPIIQAVLKADYEEFAKLDPQLNEEPFKSWFGTLHNEIRRTYADANNSNEDDEDSDGTTGNQGNPNGNVSPMQGRSKGRPS